MATVPNGDLAEGSHCVVRVHRGEAPERSSGSLGQLLEVHRVEAPTYPLKKPELGGREPSGRKFFNDSGDRRVKKAKVVKVFHCTVLFFLQGLFFPRRTVFEIKFFNDYDGCKNKNRAMENLCHLCQLCPGLTPPP